MQDCKSSQHLFFPVSDGSVSSEVNKGYRALVFPWRPIFEHLRSVNDSRFSKVFGEHHKIVPRCFICKFVKPKLRTHYSSPVQTSNHSRRRKFTLPKRESSNTYYFLYRGQHWHFLFFDIEWPAWQVISHVIDVIEGSTGQTQLASILTF